MVRVLRSSSAALSDDLRRAGLDPKGGTLFVCEGVFGYLGDTEVEIGS